MSVHLQRLRCAQDQSLWINEVCGKQDVHLLRLVLVCHHVFLSITFIPRKVDASNAGEGTLELVVSTLKSSIKAEVLMRSRGLYDVTFMPTESVIHFLSMTFNEEEVPGSPFEIHPSSVEELNDSNSSHLAIVDQVSAVHVPTFHANLTPVILSKSYSYQLVILLDLLVIQARTSTNCLHL